MAFTVGDLIRASLRKIGVLAAGEALPADEGQDALEALTNMVDAWSLETLMIPVVVVVTKTLLANQPEYTIGIYPEPVPVPLPNNHIETARPEKILTAFIRDQYETDYTVELIDNATYARISRKSNAARPARLYVRQGWPLNTLLFDSTPYASETLHLEVIQPLNEVLPTAELTDEINLPPGYKKALVDNLAIELCAEFGKEPPRLVAIQSVNGKQWIKRANYRKIVLGMDRAIANNKRAKGSYIINNGP